MLLREPLLCALLHIRYLLFLLVHLVPWFFQPIHIIGTVDATINVTKDASSFSFPQVHILEVDAPLSQDMLQLAGKKLVLDVALGLKFAADLDNGRVLDVQGLRNILEGPALVHPLEEDVHSVGRTHQAVVPALIILGHQLCSWLTNRVLQIGLLLAGSLSRAAADSIPTQAGRSLWHFLEFEEGSGHWMCANVLAQQPSLSF